MFRRSMEVKLASEIVTYQPADRLIDWRTDRRANRKFSLPIKRIIKVT